MYTSVGPSYAAENAIVFPSGEIAALDSSAGCVVSRCGDAAVDADAPQIAFGREHDRVAVNGRVAVVAGRGRVSRRSWMRERNRAEDRDRNGRMKDAFSYGGNSGLIVTSFQ